MKDQTQNALRRIYSLRRQILIDVGARHAARWKTADDLTIQLDTEFREELVEAFEMVASAIAEPASADTRPKGGDATEIAAPFTSGAVPEGQTPKPSQGAEQQQCRSGR